MEHFGLYFQMPTINMLWPCYHWTLNLEIIAHTAIIIKYCLYCFVDYSKVIQIFADKDTLVKVVCQDQEQ